MRIVEQVGCVDIECEPPTVECFGLHWFRAWCNECKEPKSRWQHSRAMVKQVALRHLTSHMIEQDMPICSVCIKRVREGDRVEVGVANGGPEYVHVGCVGGS